MEDNTSILQIKVLLLCACITSAFLWHKHEVNQAVELAVTQNTQQIELRYAKSNLQLINKSQQEQLRLEQQIKGIQNAKDTELKNVNTKYNDLLSWLQSQSSNTPESTGVPNVTTDTEGSSGIDSKGLHSGYEGDTTEGDTTGLNKEIVQLAKYAKATEELKVYLLSCYKQYDSALEVQQKYKQDSLKQP